MWDYVAIISIMINTILSIVLYRLNKYNNFVLNQYDLLLDSVINAGQEALLREKQKVKLNNEKRPNYEYHMYQ